MSTSGKASLLRSSSPAHADESQDRLAVLIDADNAPASIIDRLLAEIAKYGVASVKRIYGDWTQPQLGSWKKVLLEHSITPVQQFGYTKGKNATDSALIIDAMDLLYTGRFDGFCLVSSDSDFTRLASRLREEGLLVYGFGERKTPEPFVAACDRFLYTEVLRSTAEKAPLAEGAAEGAAAAAAEPPVDATAEPAGAAPMQRAPARTDRKRLVALIADAIDAVSDDNGWAQLGSVGSQISKLRPDFDSRLYGQRKFSDLVKSLPEHFEVDEQAVAGSRGKAIYVRTIRRGR